MLKKFQFTKSAGAGAKCDHFKLEVRTRVCAHLKLDVRGACVRPKKPSQLTPCSFSKMYALFITQFDEFTKNNPKFEFLKFSIAADRNWEYRLFYVEIKLTGKYLSCSLQIYKNLHLSFYMGNLWTCEFLKLVCEQHYFWWSCSLKAKVVI